jgi:hypothetical protein
MVPVTVSLTIPEADVARVKEAAEQLTGLVATETFKPTPKELLAALVRLNVTQWERQAHTFAPPGIT